MWHRVFPAAVKPSGWSKQHFRCSCWLWLPPLPSTSQRRAGGSHKPSPEVSWPLWSQSLLCLEGQRRVLYWWITLFVCPGWGDQLIWAQTYEEALYWSRSRYETPPPKNHWSLLHSWLTAAALSWFQEQASDGPVPPGGLPPQPGYGLILSSTCPLSYLLSLNCVCSVCHSI